MDSKNRAFDLEERTAKFGEEIIKFCRTIKEDTITKPLISQLVRSGTSVGANYMEANGASSKKDFKNKIYICKKESNESKHFLRMIHTATLNNYEAITKLWKESHELTLIFQKILFTINNGDKDSSHK